MGKGGDNRNKTSIELKRETALKKAGLEDFYWQEDPQCHRSRARLMLKQNKTVTKLMGFDGATKYKVMFAIALQLVSLQLLNDAPLWMWLFCCYTLSGTINGAMTLAMHELSHNLGGKGVVYNRILAILANLPMGLPAAATFKRYHMEHHKYMGEDEIDVDIPTDFEGSTFQHTIMKALWLFFQPAWYSLRPLVIAPKQAQLWEFINFTCTAIVDASVFYVYGIKGVAYLALGTIFGMQFHPIAGHFVAEHFVLHDEQETYSYYGPLNWFTSN